MTQPSQIPVHGQLKSLREVLDVVTDALYGERKSDLEPMENRTMELNNAARQALENSIVNICQRIDDLVTDDTLWS